MRCLEKNPLTHLRINFHLPFTPSKKKKSMGNTSLDEDLQNNKKH